MGSSLSFNQTIKLDGNVIFLSRAKTLNIILPVKIIRAKSLQLCPTLRELHYKVWFLGGGGSTEVMISKLNFVGEAQFQPVEEKVEFVRLEQCHPKTQRQELEDTFCIIEWCSNLAKGQGYLMKFNQKEKKKKRRKRKKKKELQGPHPWISN